MKSFGPMLLPALCVFAVSCYSPATVSKVPASPRAAVSHGAEVHSFRITGLSQLYVFLLPRPGVFSSDSNTFSQEELASFIVYVKALSGPISVNHGVAVVPQGEEKRVLLNRSTERVNGENRIVVNSRYSETLSLFSDSNRIPAPDNDVIITVMDPEGLTRSRGIKIVGGFQDGF